MFRLVTVIFILGCFLGPYLYIIDPKIHVLRIVTPLTLIFLLGKAKKISIEHAYVLIFYIFYYFYTLIVSAVNFSVINFKDVINFTYIPLIIIATILLISNSQEKYIKTFNKILIYFFLVSLIVSIYEEVTLNHLRLSSMNEYPTIWDGYYHMPTAFYINTNDFSVVFIMVSMFLLFTYKHKNNKLSRIFKLLIILSALWIVYITKSRISQIAFIIYLIVYFRIWQLPLKVIFSISFILAVAILIFDFNPLTKIDTNFSFEGKTSSSYRLELYQSSLLSIKDSYGLGYGINLTKHFYTNVVDSAKLGGMINPHSYLFEILINSGIIFFILYIILNIYLFAMMVLKRAPLLIITQFTLYNLLLFSSSSSLFLWPHYIFFITYISLSKKSIDENKHPFL